MNKFNWLSLSALSIEFRSSSKALEISDFSNTETDKICNKVSAPGFHVAFGAGYKKKALA